MAGKANKIPTQNDLLEIFQAQVVAITAINDLVVTSKMDKKVTDNIKMATTVVVDSTVVIFDALGAMQSFDPKTGQEAMKAVGEAGKAISIIMKDVESLAAIKMGTIRQAERGVGRLAKFLFHKGKKGIGARRVGLFTLLKEAGSKKYAKVIADGTKNLSDISKPVKEMNKTLVVVGLSLVPLALAIPALWLMDKAVGLIVVIMKRVSKAGKKVAEASKTLVDIGKAIALLGLTAVVLVLAGVFIVKNLAPLGVTILYVGILVGLFIIVSLATKWIHQGAKELMYIAAAIAILALTAVVLALTGQFITANWEAFKIVGMYMVVLLGIFLVVAIAARLGIIGEGTKQMLYIAAVVGILALIAVVLVLAGQFLKANWESLKAISLMLAMLIGMVFTVGYAAKAINNSKQSMIMLLVFVVLMTAMIVTLAVISQTCDLEQLLGTTAIMLGIILAVGGMAVAAGALQEFLAEGIPAMMLLSVICGILSTVVMGVAAAAAIADPLEILEVAGIMLLIVLAVGAISIGAGALMMGPQAVVFLAGMAAMTIISSICLMISTVGMLLAGIAKIVKSIGFNDYQELAKYVNMPFAALVRGDGEESLFDILGDLPGPVAMLKIMGKTALVAGIMVSVGLIASILQKIASLNMPDPDAGYDPKTGKPLGYKAMKSEDFAMAAQNASVILAMAAAMFGDEPQEFVLGDGSKFTVQVVNMAALEKISGSTKRKVKKLSKIVGYVSNMADTLQHIASLNMPDADAGFNPETGRPLGYKLMQTEDFMRAAVNAGSILSFFVNLFGDDPVELEFGQEKFTIAPVSEAALENITGRTKRKVKKLGEIVEVVGGMAQTLQSIASLTVPDAQSPEDFNENGTPKKWRMMTQQDMLDAATSAGSILQFFCALFDEKPTNLQFGNQGSVTINPISEEALDNITGRTKRKIEKLGTIVAVCGGMGETLQNLASLMVPDAQNPEDFNENGTPKKWRQMSEADFQNAMKMAEKMLTSIINILGDDKMAEKLSNISQRNMKKLGVAMEAVQGLSGIMDIVKSMAGGRMAVEWKRDTNPDSPTYGQEIVTKYINIADYISKNSSKITSTIRTLIMCPIEALGRIADNKSEMKRVKEVAKTANSITSVINKIKGPIKDIIDLYNNKMTNLDTEKCREMYVAVLGGALEPLLQFNPTDVRNMISAGTVKTFERVTKTMSTLNFNEKQGNQFKANVHEVSELMTTINTVDLKRLEVASDLMQHIADLSHDIRGDFNALAKAINEDLLEALKNLTDALNGFVDASADIPSMGDAVPSNSGTAGQQAKGEAGNAGDKTPAANAKDLKQVLTALTTISNKLAQFTFQNGSLKVSKGGLF